MEVGILIPSCGPQHPQPLTLVSWQMDYEKSRSRQEQDEKLLISAWYSMVSGSSVTSWRSYQGHMAQVRSLTLPIIPLL